MNNLTNKEANKLKTHRQGNKLTQQATERTKQHASSVERSRRTHENSYKYRQRKKLRPQPARLQTNLHIQRDSKQIDNRFATIINKR